MQRLLILSSNPRRDLNLEREVSDLTTAIQRLGKFEIRYGLGVRSQELPELLTEHNPQLVHFCGHGAGEQGLVFQDEQGRERFVSTEILTRLFKTLADEINCVVLNACDSDQQAEAIADYINYVVGMSQPILDQAAYFFAVGFYKALAAGKTVEQAYEMGCVAIQIWSEGNSQSTQTRQFRKAEYLGSGVQTAQLDVPEHLKPVLRKKSALPLAPVESAVQPASIKRNVSLGLVDETVKPQTEPIDLLPEFEEEMRQEIDRKDYKDQARVAYDNFGQFSAQSAVANLTKTEYDQRKILVGEVKEFWIEGFLKPSLQGEAAIKLDLKARPDESADLSQGIEALSLELDSSYEKLRETQIYTEIGQGRTLLILGTPGAGKTIALLQLAQRLIERSDQNLSLPMPIVLNLSSWARKRKPIVDWLIDELLEKYQVPRSLSEPWIRNQQIIPLLDGLDEVKEAYRNDCVRALNEFIELFPQTELAVCSRVRDYEALTERLQISSALCLQPLLSKQVYEVLDCVGGSLAGLKALLKQDSDLEQFAQTPLILNFMSAAYQGWSIDKLMNELSSTSDRRQHLFDTYIDRQLKRGSTALYRKEQVLRWLRWLAGRMAQGSRTVFLIERMQPSWLRTKAQTIFYQIGNVVIYVLAVWLIVGMFYGFAGYGKSYGLTLGLGVGLVSGLEKEIKMVETVKYSLRGIVRGLFSKYTIAIGLIGALISTLAYSLFSSQGFAVNRAVDGLIYGLSIGLSVGAANGLRGSDIDSKTIANQGIWKSIRNAGFFTVLGGLIVGLLYGPIIQSLYPDQSFVDDLHYLFEGVVSGGLIVGLCSDAGKACIQHVILRLILHRNNYIPWNYTRFLDFASDRLLMRKIGGGYVFFHRMLLEHFARMNPK
ncbi:MAG: NACHT domain-containing protein [Leptolyngbya sp. Prado105]|nr:NACHT domain-containing protein [Leptolyngbya sp. Prado105]